MLVVFNKTKVNKLKKKHNIKIGKRSGVFMQPEQKISYLGPTPQKVLIVTFCQIRTGTIQSTSSNSQSFSGPAVIRSGFKHPEADNYEL